MSLWNPYAFTPTGHRASVAAPPALRVLGGPASVQQMAMAQNAFAAFCGRSRVSFWRNPNEEGVLPDGSRYRIMVVGNSTVMMLWPVAGESKKPGRSGILLTTTINERYVNKLFMPGGDYDRPDGSWEVVDVAAGSRDAVYATSGWSGKFPRWARNRTFSTPVKKAYITSYGGFDSRRFIQEYPAMQGTPVAIVDDRALLAVEHGRGGLTINKLTLRNGGELFPAFENPAILAGGGPAFDVTPHQFLEMPDISTSAPLVDDFCISKDGKHLMAVYDGPDVVVVPGVPSYGDIVRWVVPEMHQLGVSVSPDGRAEYGYTDTVLASARPRDKYVSRIERPGRIAEYRLQGNVFARTGMLYEEGTTYFDVDPVTDWEIVSWETGEKAEYPIFPKGWGSFVTRNFPVWSERSSPKIVRTAHEILEYDELNRPIKEYFEWRGSGPVTASESSRWKFRNVLMNYYAGNEGVVLVVEGEGSFALESKGTFNYREQRWTPGYYTSSQETQEENGSIYRASKSFVTLNSGEKFYLTDFVVSENGKLSRKEVVAQKENDTVKDWVDTWVNSEVNYRAKLLIRDLYVYDPSLYLLVYVEGVAEHSGGHEYSLHRWTHEKGAHFDQDQDDSLTNNCPLPEPKFNLVIRFGSVKHTFPIRISATEPYQIKQYKLQWGVTCGVEPLWKLSDSETRTGNWGMAYGTIRGAKEDDFTDPFVNEGRVIWKTSAFFASVPRCVPLACTMPTIEVSYAKDPWTGAALLLVKPYQIAGGVSVTLTLDEPMAFTVDRQGVRRVSNIDPSVFVNQSSQVNPE